MKITKRQLKRIIREEHTRLRRQGLIKESAGKYAEIAKMLVSNNEVSINQAIELGQTVGILELEDTFRREVDNSGFGRRRKNRYEKVFCLTVQPPLAEALEIAEDSSRKYGAPMRMSSYAAGYSGGIWIFCDIS